MFKTKRPVPSPAALKVLTQLAYISSGAAVGAGVLCAEERRRRTKIVQRVADNAKAIRQHPRHIHNVALASNGGDDTELFGFFGRGSIPEQINARRRRRRLASEEVDEHNVGAARAPELPSIVERGYAEKCALDNTTPRAEATQLGAPEGASARRRPVEARATLQGLPAGARSSQHARQTRHSNRESRGLQILPKQVDDNGNGFVLKSFRRDWSGRFTERRSTQRSIDARKEPALGGAVYITKPLWYKVVAPSSVDDQMLNVTNEEIAHDVDVFFDCLPYRKSHTSKRDQHSTADQLLMLALKKGGMDDIRSLTLWKLAAGSLSESVSLLLSNFSEELSARLDQEELFAFYQSLYSTRTYRRLASNVRFQHGLRVLANFAAVCPGFQIHELAVALFGSSLRTLRNEDAISIYEHECQYLLEKDKVSLAAVILLTSQKLQGRCFRTLPTDRTLALIDRILDQALRSEHLSVCVRLFRMKHELVGPNPSQEQFNTFITACGRHKMHSTLGYLFFGYHGIKVPIEALLRLVDDSCKTILAVACSSDAKYSRTFEMIYRELPQNSRQIVNESSSIVAIETKWRTTRSVQAIEAEVSILEGWLKHAGDEQALRKLNDKMLEIYIEANRLDQALAIIARSRNTKGIDGRTIGLAAYLFAKKGAWDRLRHLLELAQHSGRSDLNAEMTRLWNKVANLYSLQHTAVETWQFVDILIQKMGMSPTHAIIRTVLQSCISKNAIDLVPEFFRYLKALGHRFQLDAREAVGLVTRYYLDNRPSHVVMFWLYRHLVECVPAFYSEEIKDVLKEAVGFDLKHFTGSDAATLRRHALIRLERLQPAERYIPQPGRQQGRLLNFSILKEQHPSNHEIQVNDTAGQNGGVSAHQSGRNHRKSEESNLNSESVGTADTKDSEVLYHNMIAAFNDDADHPPVTLSGTTDQPDLNNRDVTSASSEDLGSAYHTTVNQNTDDLVPAEWDHSIARHFDALGETHSTLR